MAYGAAIERVEAQPMAAVAAHVQLDGLADAIRVGLDKVYEVLRAKDKAGDYGQLGQNTVYYAPGDPPFDVMIGVRLAAPFSTPSAAEAGDVVPAETPAGEVVHTVYYGEYWKMRPAHDAARACAREAGRQVTGASWEVYGDWNDDWAKVRTDIYWLLRPIDG